jgi:hypothetical protein
MEVPRCDACRWWQPYESNLVGGLRECTLAGQPDSKFEACTSGGAPIITEADFGCVQFSRVKP